MSKPAKPLTGEEVARIVRELQQLELSPHVRAATAGDLDRHNSVVRTIADERLDFFDVPSAFGRVLRSATQTPAPMKGRRR